MEIIKGSRVELEEKAVELLTEKLNRFVAEKGRAVLGIPGGRSVAGIFERLKDANIPWQKVQVWWVDERYDGSNYEVAASTFLSKVPEENIHRFEGGTDVEKNIESYNEAFTTNFDIVLLGAGEDGHIASLFPNHLSTQNESPGFIRVDDAPKMPPTRMSASQTLLNKTDTALLLFFGKNKGDAYRKFASDNLSVEELPVNIIKAIKNSYVFVTE